MIVDGRRAGRCCPGLVDLHTHLREPGREDAETVADRHRAAAALGGFTAVHAMANTDPGRRHRRRRRAGLAPGPATPAGSTSARSARSPSAWRASSSPNSAPWPTPRPACGCSPTTASASHDAGAHAPRAGVRQGVRRRHRPARPGAPAHRGRPDERGRRLRRARPAAAGRPSPRRRSSPATCCSPSTSAPALHVCHLSTAGSVEIVRWAKSRGIDVTAEVTPHHLLLTDELVRSYDPVYKVNPPLRTERRRRRPCARRWPTAPSTSSPPTTPRTRTRTRSASGPRPPSA